MLLSGCVGKGFYLMETVYIFSLQMTQCGLIHSLLISCELTFSMALKCGDSERINSSDESILCVSTLNSNLAGFCFVAVVLERNSYRFWINSSIFFTDITASGTFGPFNQTSWMTTAGGEREIQKIWSELWDKMEQSEGKSASVLSTPLQKAVFTTTSWIRLLTRYLTSGTMFWAKKIQ